MTKTEAQNLMNYLELGFSIPNCKMFIPSSIGELEVFWEAAEMKLQWNNPTPEIILEEVDLGYILKNPDLYSWRRIRGGWEFSINMGKVKTYTFYWRRLQDFGIGVD